MNNGKFLPRLGRRAAVLAMASAFALAAACATDNNPASGTPGGSPASGTAGGVSAPTFTVETFNHGTFDLASLDGQPVVINFWFPSCAPCTAEMPDIQEAYERYGDRVAFVGVQQTSLNTSQEGKEFLDELGITYPNFGDQGGTVQFAYGVFNYPTTVFLDSDHSINRTWMGLISKKNLEEQVRAITES